MRLLRPPDGLAAEWRRHIFHPKRLLGSGSLDTEGRPRRIRCDQYRTEGEGQSQKDCKAHLSLLMGRGNDDMLRRIIQRSAAPLNGK